MNFENISDPKFPGLSQVVNGDYIKERLSGAVDPHGTGLRLDQVVVEEAAYFPGRKCLVHYKFVIRDKTGKTTRIQTSGKFFEDEEYSSFSGKDTGKSAIHDSKGALPNVMTIPELKFVIFRFPYDDAMPQLADCLNASSMKFIAKDLFHHHKPIIRRVDSTVLSYTPLSRAAIRYDMLMESRDFNIPERRRLVGKIDSARAASVLYARARALWIAANRKINIPVPVGFAPSHNLWVQEYLDGVRLAELAGTGKFSKHVRQTAYTLTRFQQLELPVNSVRTAILEVKSVTRWRDVLKNILPERAHEIDKIAERVSKQLQDVLVTIAPIHADLHPANILVHNDNIALVDCDNMSFGDPLLDAGRFISSLRVSSFRVYGQAYGFDNEIQGFIETYAKNCCDYSPRIKVFEAAALINSAGTGFRFQRENWKRSAMDILDLAINKSESFKAQKSVSMDEAYSASKPFSVLKSFAEDNEYMRAIVDEGMGNVYDWSLYRLRTSAVNIMPTFASYEYKIWSSADFEIPKKIEGFIWYDKHRKRAGFERICELDRLLTASSKKWRLSKPIAFVKPLGMIVFEKPQGGPMIDLTSEGSLKSFYAEVSEFFSLLIANQVADSKSFNVERYIDRSFRKFKTGEVDSLVVASLDNLKNSISSAATRLSSERVTVVPRLSLNNFNKVGNVNVVHGIRDCFLAHPCVGIADFLLSLRKKLESKFDARIADLEVTECRKTLVEATDIDESDLATVEAISLLRYAGNRLIAGDIDQGNAYLRLAQDSLNGT